MSTRRCRFFQWNDLHVHNFDVPGRSAGYPGCNEKAAWAAAAARGAVPGIAPPDFIAGIGDLIDGEIPDHSDDFRYFARQVLAGLQAPVLPALGNHENRQGEGVPASYRAYDAFWGPGWRNYLFTAGGIAFIVVDSSGAHRAPDAVTAARLTFVERALARAAGLPILLLTHVPLVALRREEALVPSFGFSSWRNLDPGLLALVNRHAARIIAVLTGHLHMTGVRQMDGIYHITPSGTAGYPADFASYDVFADRIEVRMHRAPDHLHGDAAGGDIHGVRRHGVDFTDADHPDHERYVSGNPEERHFAIALTGARRPDPAAPATLAVFHEAAPGEWCHVDLPHPGIPA